MGCMVLKKSNKRDILIFIFLIPLLLLLSLNFSAEENDKIIPYSILNKGSEGISVMYEAMEKLNYPVNLILEEIENQNYDRVQVVIISKINEGFDINSKEIKNWIGEGGKLVYLDENWRNIEVNYGKRIDGFYSGNNKRAEVISHGRGAFLMGDSKLISNKTLTKDTEGAYWILEKIDQWDYKNIEFNEFYKYGIGKKRSLWQDIPRGIKLLLYQLTLLIMAIIFYKGKRFGKPVPLYEEVERTENEYIFSAASLYRQSGCWQVVLENYYKDFLIELERVFGKNQDVGQNWLELWQRENLPRTNRAKELYYFINHEMDDTKVQGRRGKKYLDKIFLIEQLKKILIRRRENRWKILKRDTRRI